MQEHHTMRLLPFMSTTCGQVISTASVHNNTSFIVVTSSSIFPTSGSLHGGTEVALGDLSLGNHSLTVQQVYIGGAECTLVTSGKYMQVMTQISECSQFTRRAYFLCHW